MCQWELEDDPFEVKLRNNYELLEDEHLESVKRQQAFDETIEKLLLSRKVTEKAVNKMRLDLEMKKHEIYLKRHRQLYQLSTRKRKIFQVQADNLSVKLAADITIASQEKMIRIIKTDLDPVSPFPEDLRFSSMWCRQVLASISSLVCKLRNFPQPMMEMDSMCLSGRILGAEQEASQRSRRMCFVDMGPEGDAGGDRAHDAVSQNLSRRQTQSQQPLVLSRRDLGSDSGSAVPVLREDHKAQSRSQSDPSLVGQNATPLSRPLHHRKSVPVSLLPCVTGSLQLDRAH